MKKNSTRTATPATRKTPATTATPATRKNSKKEGTNMKKSTATVTPAITLEKSAVKADITATIKALKLIDDYTRAAFFKAYPEFKKVCPDTIITVSADANKRIATGFFPATGIEWKAKDGGKALSISVTGGALSEGIPATIAEFIHTYTHIYALVFGIKETASRMQSHNKRFADIINGHIKGFTVDEDDRTGAVKCDSACDFTTMKGYDFVLEHLGEWVAEAPEKEVKDKVSKKLYTYEATINGRVCRFKTQFDLADFTDGYGHRFVRLEK